MKKSNIEKKESHFFWNGRAGFGQAAGSRDLIAKELEIEAISKYIFDGMRVLDAGCGNGITAIEIAKKYNVNIVGFDFSEEMIKAAKALSSSTKLKGTIDYHVIDISNMPDMLGMFDLIYSERILINLHDWPSQKRAIIDLTELLVNGGVCVMCENSQDGLNKINLMREMLELPEIEPPWHNRYIRDNEIERLSIPGARLENVEYFSSTYYFLSRVINAWFAAQEGKDPEYDAKINQLALRLPPIGDIGQTRIWLWRKDIGSSQVPINGT